MRQSGRTSRMLNEAVELARADKDVIIIAANRVQARQLSAEILTYNGVTHVMDDKMQIQFLGVIRIKHIHDHFVDMRTGTVHGWDDTVLIDHYAQEVYDGRIT